MTTHARRPSRALLAPLLATLLLGATAGTAAASPPSERELPLPARDVYVAMGDSFTAGTGTGLPDLDAACQRSSLSYPALVVAERPNTDLTFVACGFGVTTEGFVETQVQVLDRHTDFVTLTLGGNDVGFAPIATACVGGTESQCLGLAAQAAAYIQTAFPEQLATAYDAIRDRVRKAEVIVVGYPKFYADAFSPCQQALGITATEAATLNALVTTLDAVIGAQARAAGFTYVSTLEAFSGHDMCAPEPWINGVVAPTPNDRYHPTAAGYEDGFAPLVLEAMEKRQPSVSQVERG